MRIENPLQNNNPIEKKEDSIEEIEKNRVWEETMKKIEKITDNLGYPIDKNIREAVIASKLLGVETSSSCEGHINNIGLRPPYIEIQSPDQPERWRGVNEELSKIPDDLTGNKLDKKKGEDKLIFSPLEPGNSAQPFPLHMRIHCLHHPRSRF